ncbi:MAG: hypothetical protein JWL89_253 [Candidatus Saccharibacteria bacterium]|jgi:hypothetical protein|nr:hypothetical protein [Candidatus Saccharibacteria bacterium]
MANEQQPSHVPDHVTEEEFFAERDAGWRRDGTAREKVAEDFTEQINQLFDNNPLSRFITIHRVDDQSYTRPIEVIWEAIRRQHSLAGMLSEEEIEQRVAYFKEGLKTAVRDSVAPPTPTYHEHLYAADPHGYQTYVIERIFQGGEISSWQIPIQDVGLWMPPEGGSIDTTYTVIRYKMVDDKGRPVEVVRQQKEFFKRSNDSVVQYSEHSELPNPIDYGTNEVARKLFEEANERALTHYGAESYDADHFIINNLIRQLGTAAIDSPPFPVPVIQFTSAHHPPDRPLLPPDPPDMPKPMGDQTFYEQFRVVGF